jgi:hypothetical protein
MTDNLAKAIQHLSEMADGFECGATVENSIVRSFQHELDAFSGSRVGDTPPQNVRLIRAVLDARSNRDGFARDAAAIRTVLASLREPHEEQQP